MFLGLVILGLASFNLVKTDDLNLFKTDGINLVKGDDTFIAAVAEPVTSEHLLPYVTKESALRVINKNLDNFEELIKTAATQKSKIIVFPEYGITGFGQKRKTAPLYAEKVPNPYSTRIIPCYDLKNTTILQRLSCFAIRYNIVIVANVIAIEPCLPNDTGCPNDGHYIYNTDVAFERSGQLVARYHKINVYAAEKEIFDFGEDSVFNYGVFTTEFATIGLFTCFDMLFSAPAVYLVNGVGIDTMVFPTAWMNELPLLSAVEYQEAWAVHYNATLLASNQHLPLVKMTGSGIYNGDKGALTYHYDMVTYRSKLLIVEVPKRKNININLKIRSKIISKLREMDYESLKEVSPVIRGILSEDNSEGKLHSGDGTLAQQQESSWNSKTQSTFHGILNDDLYTFKPLDGATGQISICNGTICCYLNYTREEKQRYEFYALGVFDGLHTHNGRYYLQTCSLVRCQENEGTKCGGEIETARSIFKNISLRITGYNPEVHLFPEVVTNRVNLAVIGKEWVSEFPHDHIRSVGNGITEPLVAANILGRWYERDADIP